MIMKCGKWLRQHIENIFTSLPLVLAENSMQSLVVAVTGGGGGWGGERTTFKIMFRTSDVEKLYDFYNTGQKSCGLQHYPAK